MTDPALTRHAEARMRQRGLRDADIPVLLAVATPLANDAWLVTDADAEREIARLKRKIAQLQRLRGCKIVVAGDVLVTVCHMRKAPARSALRKGRAKR